MGVRGGSAPATNKSGHGEAAPAASNIRRLVGLTLQNTNTLTAEGPEIKIKPVGTRRVFSGGGAQ
ncbi:hypothetical protein GCM10025787_19160 [Saccharopolyspora rosea]